MGEGNARFGLLRRELVLCAMALALSIGCDDDDAPGPGPNDAGAHDARVADAEVDTPDPELPQTEWQSLFDATLSAWYTFLPSQGRDRDATGVFRMDGADVLHVLGNDPPAGEQEFGYVATREEFGNYRFRVEQRWGTRKFAPRADAVRDSGLLYHMTGADLVWPRSVEYQIQENDIGDLFLLGDVGATTPLNAAGSMFEEGGTPKMLRSGALKKGGTYESLTDWNDVELFASGREYTHSINGHVNHRGWNIEVKDGESWVPLERGRIVLQAEGAEVFYRSAQLRPLDYAKPPSGATVLFDGSSLEAWQSPDGGEPGWQIVDGALQVEPGAAAVETRERYADFRLHLELRLPAAVGGKTAAEVQLVLDGRYVLLLADTYGTPLSAATSGALAGHAPAFDEAFPPEVWQSVDLVFRSARWSANGKRPTRTPRATVVYNGTEIHKARELPLPANASPGPAPIRIEPGANNLSFRNIWLERL